MTQDPYSLHEQAMKTASALKYVVVPLEGNTPIPATFVQPTDGDAADIARDIESRYLFQLAQR